MPCEPAASVVPHPAPSLYAPAFRYIQGGSWCAYILFCLSIPKARARHPPNPSLPGGSFGSSPNPHCDPDWGFVIRFPPTATDITVPLANTWTRWHPRKPPRPNPCPPAGRVSNGSLQFSKLATIWLPVQSISSAQTLKSAKGHYNQHFRTAT
ncbi:hypothetical protein EDB82DRAFT_471703 [Fusarium venenatum]|uniref:uncharacterized protein n=1 Tax=Fusarium venenatum TaxID=56646 RepID=UPI001DD91D30|nr:hypothetical protein EDB82DRAFT_471703 [Fusarium venenatum]